MWWRAQGWESESQRLTPVPAVPLPLWPWADHCLFRMNRMDKMKFTHVSKGHPAPEDFLLREIFGHTVFQFPMQLEV